METGMFENILEQIGPQLAWVNLYFQGEPYLNPGFLEMASIARARNLHVVSSTNGHFLTPDTARKTVRSGLDKLIVSLDGATQESYSAYRTGGRLEKVIEGLKHLADAKEELGSKRPKVVVQCLLLKTNLHEQDQVRQIVKNAKADKVEFKTAQFYDFEKGNVLMPEGKYSRYRVDQSTSRLVTTSPHYVLNNKLRNSCFRMWSSCVITWDGLVVPCCFDKDAGHVMGDLKVQPFEEIWNGEKYRAFRKKILQDRKSMDICRNCSQKF
jgi:radical SAM protein with 4Fe4S-binding SPASM domain